MEAMTEPTMLLEIERELAGPEKDSALVRRARFSAARRRAASRGAGRASMPRRTCGGMCSSR